MQMYAKNIKNIQKYEEMYKMFFKMFLSLFVTIFQYCLLFYVRLILSKRKKYTNIHKNYKNILKLGVPERCHNQLI